MKQTVLPRNDSLYGGVDWGARRRLIAATPNKAITLFIREGHSAAHGARGFGRDYHPAALILTGGSFLAGEHFIIEPRRWHDLAKGRISNKTLADPEIAKKINLAFGVGDVAWALDVRKTKWITPGGVTEIA